MSLGFHNAPAPPYDVYDEDFEVLDLYVEGSDQQIHEDIQLIIHEQLEPVFDSYASKGNMEEEDQLGDSHVDIVVDVNQEAFQ